MPFSNKQLQVTETLEYLFLFSILERSFRPYVALFFVNSVHQLILKAILQCSFENPALHIVHALSSLATFAFFVLEIFVYEYFQQSTASFTQLLFSGTFNILSFNKYTSIGLTVLLTVVLWSSIVKEEAKEPTERESRPRRLIARHYMETQIKDFETDPKKLK